MQLIILHRIMIATAILFCFGFGARQFATGSIGMGGFFVAAGVGLTAYLMWFVRKQVAPLE